MPSKDGDDPTRTLGQDLDSFQKIVTEELSGLSSVGNDDFLSLSWVENLLDLFMRCQEEFRVIMFKHRSGISKSTSERWIHEYYERSIRYLDVCNVIYDEIDRVIVWNQSLDIVICSLCGHRMVSGQFRRAKRALLDLSTITPDDKETVCATGQRIRLSGNHALPLKTNRQHINSHSRSQSCSMPSSYPAKLVQTIAGGLVAPRSNEIVATHGVALAHFTMSYILIFVMWVLVVAVAWQDRIPNLHLSVPKHFLWSSPITSLHERVCEELKRREKRNTAGLLREILQVDKLVKTITDLLNNTDFPLTKEKEKEIQDIVQELSDFHIRIEEGSKTLKAKAREVVHQIVNNQLECI